MSKSVVRGEIKNFSPKPSEDYYGILVDVGGEEKWMNGDKNVPDNLSKGDKVKIKINKDAFKEIEEINVIGGANGDGATREGDVDNDSSIGESTVDPVLSPKDTRIMLQTAFKEACQDVRHERTITGEEFDEGERLDFIGERTNGYFNLMKAQVKDKTGGGE